LTNSEPELLPARPEPASEESPAVLAAGALFAVGLALGLFWAGGFWPGAAAIPFEPGDGSGSLLVPVDLAEPAARKRAMGALRLSPAERGRLERFLAEDDDVGLGWVAIVDTMDPDGDTVRISGLGFNQDVVAGSSPQVLAVPYRRGGDIEVTGMRDGAGGGITVAVMTAQGPFPLKFLGLGETIRIKAP
jgi:hypothetical protein